MHNRWVHSRRALAAGTPYEHARLAPAGDAHFRVAAAALEALGAGLAGKGAKLFEPQLDRLMPALFIR